MNSLIKHIVNTCVAGAAMLLSVSCQDYMPTSGKLEKVKTDGTITIEGSIVLPDMSSLQTRGSLAKTPGEGLRLTLVEFDLGADADHTFTTNTYEAIRKSTSAVDNGELVTFDVTLTATAQPKVLHLFIADNYVKPEYGSVATVFPSLIVGQTDPEVDAPETEGYWGYVNFPDGYHVTTDAEGNTVVDKEKLKEDLTAVPVIRNFAQINVEVDTVNVNNFELIGFDLINVPTSGTIAPWDSENDMIPDLLTGEKKMKDFTAVAPVYHGTMPGNASIRNQEADAKNWTNLTAATKYMYEHPYEETRRTYLIVQGVYKTLDDYGNVTSETPGYYKLDIGKVNPDGTYDYYNILRNYRYNVKISEVLAAGMPTVAEAIARAPYNNLIAATETSSMLNVSNGKNMLIVNDTNHIVVNESDTIKVLYRYITDVTNSKNPDNSIPTTPGLEPGAVIKEVLPTKTVTDEGGAEWVEIDILPNTPGDFTETQDFSIVDSDGLGRTIHLILRKPWQYSPIVANGTSYSATIARGTENLYQGAPQNISNAAGAELTVYFNLPDGLLETMFPLEFKLEALKQGIENNKIGDMVVSTGPSLFSEKEGQIVISYIKTVSYNEYIYNYRNDGSNDVNTSSRNTNHTVRCRFTTISAESTVDAEIRIHNDYFNPDASVTFQRVTNP
ncbi:MAG: hypothetical protein K2L17_07280 [Muribaculaceae bacterium]|nr:hypothetical protein [Muribaculaceae bacterium]